MPHLGNSYQQMSKKQLRVQAKNAIMSSYSPFIFLILFLLSGALCLRLIKTTEVASYGTSDD